MSLDGKIGESLGSGPPTEPTEPVGNSFTQWASYGTGYIPTTKTIKTIPPGAYRVGVSSNGVFLSQTKLYTDDLLIFPDSVTDQIVSEIDRFWEMKPMFQSMGLTHKRGILTYGPPGSGKTGTISLVSKRTIAKGNIVILANGFPSNTSIILSHMRQFEPDRPIVVVMEDLDTIIKSYGESEVLALLDGESSIDNVLFLATTNYPEELDGRITNRPSRFDLVIKVDMPSAQSRQIYLESRKLNLSKEEMFEWVDKSEGFSIAQLKELIISVKIFGRGVDETVERLKNMGKKPSSSGDKKSIGFEAKLENELKRVQESGSYQSSPSKRMGFGT